MLGIEARADIVASFEFGEGSSDGEAGVYGRRESEVSRLPK
jgi:hypothetical protein